MRQADITTLLAILDTRRATLAIELFNEGPSGRQRLADRPDLVAILLEMARAQQGDATTMDDVYRDLSAAYPAKETPDA